MASTRAWRSAKAGLQTGNRVSLKISGALDARPRPAADADGHVDAVAHEIRLPVFHPQLELEAGGREPGQPRRKPAAGEAGLQAEDQVFALG